MCVMPQISLKELKVLIDQAISKQIIPAFFAFFKKEPYYVAHFSISNMDAISNGQLKKDTKDNFRGTEIQIRLQK